MSWKESEELAYMWYKNNIDNDAVKYGDNDSTTSDIWSPKINGWVEIKEATAQCGQFTRETANKYKYASYIMSKDRKDVTSEDSDNFSRNYYKDKEVKKFIRINKDNTFELLDIDDFFNSSIITLENRTTKSSGSRPLSKYAYKYIPKEWEYEIINDRPVIINDKYLGATCEFTNTKGEKSIMWVSNKVNQKSYKEIRILSNTKNETWIFQACKR